MALEKNLLLLLSLWFKGRDNNVFFSKPPNGSFTCSVRQQMFIQCLLDAGMRGPRIYTQCQHTHPPPWEVSQGPSQPTRHLPGPSLAPLVFTLPFIRPHSFIFLKWSN